MCASARNNSAGKRGLEPVFRLGVSRCLLGDPVRYDGASRPLPWLLHGLAEELGGQVQWLPVCPEVGIGLGVPRPIIRLVDDGAGVRVQRPLDGLDLTENVFSFARLEIDRWSDAGICGAILKARSPSCGLGDVEVHTVLAGALAHRAGTGIFAAAAQAALGALPLVTEAMLGTAAERAAFVAAVKRWQAAAPPPERSP